MASSIRTLFIFLDESGNMDFSENGTAHFVLAAVTAVRPLESSRQLQRLKYNFLEQGHDIEQFHASEDRQFIRNKVLGTLSNLDTIHVNFIYTLKSDTPQKYREATIFYSLLGKVLLEQTCASHAGKAYDQIVVIFDKALTHKGQDMFLKAVKPALKHLGKPFHIYFHRTFSDYNAQIADYLAWSRYVSLERDEQRPLKALASVSMEDFEIFKRKCVC